MSSINQVTENMQWPVLDLTALEVPRPAFQGRSAVFNMSGIEFIVVARNFEELADVEANFMAQGLDADATYNCTILHNANVTFDGEVDPLAGNTWGGTASELVEQQKELIAGMPAIPLADDGRPLIEYATKPAEPEPTTVPCPRCSKEVEPSDLTEIDITDSPWHGDKLCATCSAELLDDEL